MDASQASFAEVVRRANLRSLRALSLHAEVSDFSSLSGQNLEADIHESHDWDLSSDRSGMSVRLNFEVTFSPAEESNQARFTAAITFELVYQFDEALSDDPKVNEALRLFAEKNPRFNAWPFLREYINYAATYAGLPGVLLPLLKPFAQGPPKARGSATED